MVTILYSYIFLCIYIIFYLKNKQMKKDDLGLGISGKKAQINSIFSNKSKIVNSPVPAKSKVAISSTQKKSSIQKPIAKDLKKQQIKKVSKQQIQNPENMNKKQQIVQKKEIQSKKEQNIPIKQQDIKRLVMIKYSHYKDKFEVINDFIKFQPIDEKYCISFVFKGNFIPNFKDLKTNQYAQKRNGGWILLHDEYLLEIEQDEIQQAKYEKKTYKAQKQKQQFTLKSKNKRLDELTGELKGLSINQLKEKTDKYKELIEQRDLEDILYK